MNFSRQDSAFMARAIQVAKRGWFTTRANPRVGCVIVKDNQIIAEGWHRKPGLNHAEINAIENAQEEVTGATAYVTLEPCSHFGRKPPCSLALVKAGIKRVVCAMQDPNPMVSGQGIEDLKKAGIKVEVGLMQQSAEALNPGFIKRMKTGLPRVVVKSAISLDGKIAMASGESQWITSKAARADVQRLRAEAGAIITGSGTVISDDPSMNVREVEFLRDKFFEQPLRVIIDSQHLVESSAKIFQQEGSSWLVSGDWSSKEYPASVNQELVGLTDSGKIDLYELLLKLADQGVNDVLIEAGAGLATAFIEQKLVDELVVYMAPKLMGSDAQSMLTLPFSEMAQSKELELLDLRQLDSDLKLNYRFKD